MSKKHYEIVAELDPAEVKNVPEVHKKHYSELGYKPYRMGDGRVKWLTDAEKVYTETKSAVKSFGLKKSSSSVSNRKSRHKRRHRNRFYAFISDNWFIFIIIALAIFIYLFFRL